MSRISSCRIRNKSYFCLTPAGCSRDRRFYYLFSYYFINHLQDLDIKRYNIYIFYEINKRVVFIMIFKILKKNNLQSGFTLLEILLVVGIIAILAGIVIVAINPSRQLATVRDTERKSDIKQISNAITQYYIDKGYYPPGLTATSTEICNTGDLTTTEGSDINCSGLIDLTPLIPVYLTAIPKDPGTATVNSTHYKIAKNASANVYTEATDAEIAPTINVGSPSGVEGANIASSTDQGGGSSEDITTGLIVHYKMNDDSADTVIEDSSGNANDAVCQPGNTQDYTQAGRIGKSLRARSIASIDIPTDEFSVSLWYKGDTGWGSVQQALFYSTDGSIGIMGYQGKYGVFATYGNGNYILFDGQTNVNVKNNTWTHLVLVKSGTYGAVYENGHLIGSRDDLPESWSHSGVFGLGGMTDGQITFSGSMDDFRVYDRALTEPQISALAAGTEN